MSEKNHGIWTNRPAVQKAFDARNPQDIFQIVSAVINAEQAKAIEAALCPEPSAKEAIEELAVVAEIMAKHGVPDDAIREKIEALEKVLDSDHNS